MGPQPVEQMINTHSRTVRAQRRGGNLLLQHVALNGAARAIQIPYDHR